MNVFSAIRFVTSRPIGTPGVGFGGVCGMGVGLAVGVGVGDAVATGVGVGSGMSWKTVA